MPYIGNQPGTGVRSRFIYTATASQTTFSGADDNSKTLKYADSAYVDVFLNGVCLVPGTDYTASTKTSIVLTQAASLSDTLEVIAYDVASMDDSISESNGGTFQADVTFADGADILTASKGTDNVRLGENAGAAIASGGNQNVTIGKDAGTALTTGDDNVAVGHSALKTEDGNGRNTDVGFEALLTLNAGVDGENVAVGYRAGKALTEGIQNTLIGVQAGDALTHADYNTAIGRNALSNDTEGHRSTAIGVGALNTQNFSSSTTSYNTAVGYNAGTSIQTGQSNTIMGDSAGDAISTGGLNVAIGTFAGSAATTVSNNTFVGAFAGDAATSGDNTGVGSGALGGSLTGDQNVAVGKNAGNALTSASDCVMIGHLAGVSATSCTDVTLVGEQAGGGATLTGNQNTLIGRAAGYAISSGANNICLGANAGRASSPSGNIQTGSDTICLGNNDINDLFCADTSISSSDSRDKTDVTNFTGGLDWIKELRPVTYKWDKRTWYGDEDNPMGTPDGSKKRDRLHLGFLAQEVLAIEQDKGFADTNDTSLVVRNNLDGNSYGLKYERLVPVLVNAVKELSAKNDALEAQNTTQATQIADLITRVTALEAG